MGKIKIKPFFIDKVEVPGSLYEHIADWAKINNYIFDFNDPIQTPPRRPKTQLKYQDIIAWCNARSEYYNLELSLFSEQQSFQRIKG